MADLSSTQVARNYGKAAAGAFYGYQPTFFLITGTNVGTADSESGGVTTLGTFSKAVFAISQLASIVFVGPRANNGFVVAIDDATFKGTRNGASDGSAETAAEAIDRVVTAATGVSTTVAVKTLTLADFA